MPNLYGGVSLNTAKEGECKMQFVTSKILSVIDVNLGRCPRCMKTAFLCALFSWPVYFFVQNIQLAGRHQVVCVLNTDKRGLGLGNRKIAADIGVFLIIEEP